jgi:hypothetical protein
MLQPRIAGARFRGTGHTFGPQESHKSRPTESLLMSDSQSSSGNQKKKCHLPGLLQGAEGHRHFSLENTYLLQSDEFAYAPIEQLILNQLLNVLVKALKMKSETHRDSESALEPH